MGAAETRLLKEPGDPLLDDLTTPIGVPERTFYEAGVLLDAEDFFAEQRYHRSRLARALSALHGYGTIAGLKVSLAADAVLRREGHLEVSPGLALDRFGRLVELRRAQCFKVANWLAAKAAQPEEKRQTVLDDFDAARGRFSAGVQIRFAACNHGVTPAFAAGPFNATDYVAPARSADAFSIELVPLRLAAPAAEDAPYRQYAQLLANPPADNAKLHADLAAIVIEQTPFPPARDAATGEAMPWVLLAHVLLPARRAVVNGQDFIELDAAAIEAGADAELVLNGVRPLAFNLWHWQSPPL